MNGADIAFIYCPTDKMHTSRHTFLDLSSKVLGSILGKSLIATGSRNSMNGMIKNTVKGTSRKRSATVLRNCVER